MSVTEELVTPEWLTAHGATEKGTEFFLHGFNQGNQITFGFQRDSIDSEDIGGWFLLSARGDRIWLPLFYVGPMMQHRVSLGRFYLVVLAMNVNIK